MSWRRIENATAVPGSGRPLSQLRAAASAKSNYWRKKFYAANLANEDQATRKQSVKLLGAHDERHAGTDCLFLYEREVHSQNIKPHGLKSRSPNLCFYFVSCGRKSDWTVIIVWLVLGGLGMWIGKFKFKKNKGGRPDA
jgi:hypothetical protein